uniref:Uncharacterized protein n=1 Tax=Ciona savignyi TaxID=51511 RepID=H2YXJ5_CIOSA
FCVLGCKVGWRHQDQSSGWSNWFDWSSSQPNRKETNFRGRNINRVIAMSHPHF